MLGFAVKAAPTELVLLLLLGFLALVCFDLFSVLDDGGVLVELNLGLFVGGLRKVLLLRLGWLGFVLLDFGAVAFFAARGGGSLTSGLGLLVLLLLASLLLEQVLNNLLLVTHR